MPASWAGSTTRCATCSDADVFAEVLAEVPDAWLEPVPGADSPDAVRAAYVSFLAARLESRQWLPQVVA